MVKIILITSIMLAVLLIGACMFKAEKLDIKVPNAELSAEGLDSTASLSNH